MINTLSPTQIVRLISLLAFAFGFSAIALTDPRSTGALWALKASVLSGPAFVVFLLTLPPVFRFAHRLLFAKTWLFPLLDGEWEAEISSNWSRIEFLIASANRKAPRFNVLSDTLPPEANKPAERAKVTIKSGLVEYKIDFEISETRRSTTLFVKPVWNRPHRPRLYYIYYQQEDGHVERPDVFEHEGAAYLDYDSKLDILSGPYWTKRQSELGINTAGRLILRRRPAP